MNKINVNLYGGKSIFGGRETPLNADITYCDKYKQCSFYKKGKCFSTGRIGPDCKFGNKQNIQGYTRRAIKYGEFKRKYEEDECYGKLKEPNNKIGKIGDTFVINMEYLHEKEGGGYEIETHWLSSPLIYIPEKEFSNNLISLICDGKPRTIFDDVVIKDYQEKAVPRFLYELKTEFSDIYNRFINEYPEYKDKEMNFVGRYAYINTLKNGAELKDCHNNIWKIENDEIVCYKWKTWLPFGKETPTETRIKITDDMKYKITDNSQVGENTKFEG